MRVDVGAASASMEEAEGISALHVAAWHFDPDPGTGCALSSMTADCGLPMSRRAYWCTRGWSYPHVSEKFWTIIRNGAETAVRCRTRISSTAQALMRLTNVGIPAQLVMDYES